MTTRLTSATIISLLTNNIRHFNKKVLERSKDSFTTPTKLYCYLGDERTLKYLDSQWQVTHTLDSMESDMSYYKLLQAYDYVSTFDTAEAHANLWKNQSAAVLVIESAIWAMLGVIFLYWSAPHYFSDTASSQWFMPAGGLGLFGVLFWLFKRCQEAQEEQMFSTLQRYALARNTVCMVLEYEQQTHDLNMEPRELLFVLNYLSDIDFVPYVSVKGCADERFLLKEIHQNITTARNAWSSGRCVGVSA